jgi:hypothetical protein
MNKKTIILIVLLAGVIVLGVVYGTKKKGEHVDVSGSESIAYLVEGTEITLKDGVSIVPSAPGSASMVTTRYFGNAATGDLNADGADDTAFLITQNSGGSGTFFYVVAALKQGDTYVGTNAVLLGDRIAPQSTELKDGKVTVNYAERKPSEPMTATPSVGVSKHFKIVDGKLAEVK